MKTLSVIVKPMDFGETVTKLALQNRFPPGSLVAIDIASLDPGPTVPAPDRQFAATVRVELQKVFNSEYVTLSHSDLIDSITQFEVFNLIPPGSTAQIVALPVGSAELPTPVREQYGLPYVVRDDERAQNNGRGYYSPAEAGL